MFESVAYQFLPGKYGAIEVAPSKWNIIVVSIEGLLSSIISSKDTDKEQVLINILVDTPVEGQRDNRDPKAEENTNIGILRNFLKTNEKGEQFISINNSTVFYKELKLSALKTFRNNKDECLKYFNKYCN